MRLDPGIDDLKSTFVNTNDCEEVVQSNKQTGTIETGPQKCTSQIHVGTFPKLAVLYKRDVVKVLQELARLTPPERDIMLFPVHDSSVHCA